MKRAVGYCTATSCQDYAKGVFLLNFGDNFHCPRCRNLGTLECERGFASSNESQDFREVRMEYNFDAITRSYREVLILVDEEMEGGATYTFQTPVIKTERRAEKVATAILANLNRYMTFLNEEGIPNTAERILDLGWDRERFSKVLGCLAAEWRS
ncbi:MAG: hypothetical protein L0Y64_24320 [Myxococcaceae bacterium]|nr:hypothetical protein [Myxococcaceae bacterium]